MNHKIIKVNLDPPYNIYVGSNLESHIQIPVKEALHSKKKIVVLCDQAIADHYPNFLKKTFPRSSFLILPGGEKIKTLKFFEKVHLFLQKENFLKDGIIFIIGGGAIGDLGAFVASTYMRGVDYYHVPTTLLAMVDSAIGGKTGVNLGLNKNFIGTTSQPKAVFIDIQFLTSLPKRELISGFAEIIKYGLIKNTKLFNQLLQHGIPQDSTKLLKMIELSIKVKKELVEKDPLDSEKHNLRILLNFGHTFGHSLESVTQFKKYLHGEAVGIGMTLAAQYSTLTETLKESDYQTIKSCIQTIGLPTSIKYPLNPTHLINQMYLDKKCRQGHLRLLCLRSIGTPIIVEDVDHKILKKVWKDALIFDK